MIKSKGQCTYRYHSNINSEQSDGTQKMQKGRIVSMTLNQGTLSREGLLVMNLKTYNAAGTEPRAVVISEEGQFRHHRS
jgi:hypothetical protein